MLKKIAVKFACFLLSKNLSFELKNKLVTAVLDSLDALPLKETITINENGETEIEGKVIDIEKAIQIREYANSALDNPVEKIIKEPVAYEAIVNGVHKTTGDAGQLFMRAALWWEQTRENHLKKLSGRE